jgi:glycolate oxidase FAD binding subunit
MAADAPTVDRLLASVATGGIRSAGPGDAIGGVAPRWVVTPSDTAEVAAVLATTSVLDLAVVARGAGTTVGWGAPPRRFDVLLDTTALSGIVEHVAGDLVAVVRAGTRLTDLQAALRPSGQRLALDGEHGEATIGGLLAQGLSGPSRLLHGTLRDLLIGATVVRADGVVAHSGGKVVKNVAGYDLGKLLHGSWGTLGVITEVVVRLHPLPAARRWVTAAPGTAGAPTSRVLGARSVPAALEVDRPSGAAATVAVMVEGPAATIEGRAEGIADLLGPAAAVTTEPPPWWGRRPPGAVLLRVTTEVAGLDRLLAAEPALHIRGSAGVGSLHATLPDGTGAGEVAAVVEGLRQDSGKWGGSVVVVDGPVDRLAGIDRWGPVEGLELMRRVKDRFDPGGLLSPGRFVGGI